MQDSVERLYAAVEESAGLLDVPCEREKVLPLLRVYGEGLADAVVAFRVSTGARGAGELDCRFTVPTEIDPYELAVHSGLIEKDDHPAGKLLAEIAERFPVDGYGIDFGVVGGFKKVWVVFPRDALQPLTELAALPSMPRALKASLGFFGRHALGDAAGLLGIDYRSRTVNIYFGELPQAGVAPEAVRAVLREAGQAAPSAQLLRLGQRAFGVYVTLNWDEPEVERICFAVATANPAELPVQLDPRVERFVAHVIASTEHPKFVYAVASLPDGEYYKLQSYYRWRDEVMDIMQLSDGVLADPV